MGLAIMFISFFAFSNMVSILQSGFTVLDLQSEVKPLWYLQCFSAKINSS